ncbi:MAG: hypothetical protein ACJAR4_002380, partial [Psychroserpens sp.]
SIFPLDNVICIKRFTANGFHKDTFIPVSRKW